MYPEYRGNGVMASLGNISENGHVGILFVDFFRSTVGLHVNGTARIIENDASALSPRCSSAWPASPSCTTRSRTRRQTPERWVLVEVVEAYIHCSKHIPLLKKLDKDIDWGTDSEVRKGGDYFKAKHDPRPWAKPAAPKRPRTEEPAEEPRRPRCRARFRPSRRARPSLSRSRPSPSPRPSRCRPGPAAPDRRACSRVGDDAARPHRALSPSPPSRSTRGPSSRSYGYTAPPQAEQARFGPEILLEEERADADSRAAAAEHTTDEPGRRPARRVGPHRVAAPASSADPPLTSRPAACNLTGNAIASSRSRPSRDARRALRPPSPRAAARSSRCLPQRRRRHRSRTSSTRARLKRTAPSAPSSGCSWPASASRCSAAWPGRS